MIPRSRSGSEFDVTDSTPIFVISVAAQLAGMHPQTLRQYDRLGLVSPGRSSGRGRRYSAQDVSVLREIQRLSQDEGVSLAGIKRILTLRARVAELEARLDQALIELEQARLAGGQVRRVFAAGPSGDVLSVTTGRRPARSAFGQQTAVVLWRPSR
ncbi:MAG: heat shock protein transcriptional repressor HspR [Actinomycetota bacterium]